MLWYTLAIYIRNGYVSSDFFDEFRRVLNRGDSGLALKTEREDISRSLEGKAMPPIGERGMAGGNASQEFPGEGDSK